MSQQVCLYSKYGHCKKGNTVCRNIHFTIICTDENCEMSKCNKRHPKECRFYNQFESLADKLTKTKSIEAECDECEYVGRNAARVIKHKEVKLVHICEVCEYEFIGDAEFERHKKLVHLNSDTVLTEKEFDELNDSDKEDIRCGPDSPRRQEFTKRYLLRKR